MFHIVRHRFARHCNTDTTAIQADGSATLIFFNGNHPAVWSHRPMQDAIQPLARQCGALVQWAFMAFNPKPAVKLEIPATDMPDTRTDSSGFETPGSCILFTIILIQLHTPVIAYGSGGQVTLAITEQAASHGFDI